MQRQAFFARCDLTHGRRDISEQFFSLRCQPDTAVGSVKQCAAKRLLQIFNGSGHIGLIAIQYFRSFGKAFVLGHIVKDPIIVVTDVHVPSCDIRIFNNIIFTITE